MHVGVLMALLLCVWTIHLTARQLTHASVLTRRQTGKSRPRHCRTYDSRKPHYALLTHAQNYLAGYTVPAAGLWATSSCVGTRYNGGEIDSPCHSRTDAFTLCQPSVAARYAAYPASQVSGLQWHLGSIHFDSGTRRLDQLGPRSPPSLPSAKPPALHLHDGNALISSHLLTLSAQVPCLAIELVDI
jgi:hypothetical protein